MAIDLVRRGFSIPAVMQVGRWKSAVMVAWYVKAEEAASGAVAEFYGRKRSGSGRPGTTDPAGLEAWGYGEPEPEIEPEKDLDPE